MFDTIWCTLRYYAHMKEIIAHAIAFLLGVAVASAYFLNAPSSQMVETKTDSSSRGQSQPIAPAGMGNPNQSKHSNHQPNNQPPTKRGPQ